MKRITFCDLNKGLCEKVEKLFEQYKTNRWNINFNVHNGDIIEYQKKNGGKIATASNPSFTMGGGLDAVIAKNFPEEVKESKEFHRTDNLFFTITVGDSIKASKTIVTRALIGCFAYANEDIIISGFGTSIGGLNEDDFMDCLTYVVSANLSSANLRYADLSSANLRYADLSYANLRYADLSSANLIFSDLRYADLSSANLSSANLRYADLSSADLSSADLSSANLRSADLSSADLSSANLRSANLRYADLSYANLSYANLSSANLSSANLRYADLSYANLSYANLRSANLSYAKELDKAYFNELTSFFALACPEEGSFIGFKKVDGCIIKLRIPAKAKRSSATTRKCRCEYAKVVSIVDKYGKNLDSITNNNYSETKYIVGEYVYPDKWDDDRWNECSNGIHFFITKKEVEQW